MTDTECTTRTPGSATHRRTQQRRRKVEHYYWETEGRVAEELGVDLKTLCGVWSTPPRWEGFPDTVETVGRLMAIPEPADCKRCLRVLEAALARGVAR